MADSFAPPLRNGRLELHKKRIVFDFHVRAKVKFEKMLGYFMVSFIRRKWCGAIWLRRSRPLKTGNAVEMGGFECLLSWGRRPTGTNRVLFN